MLTRTVLILALLSPIILVAQRPINPIVLDSILNVQVENGGPGLAIGVFSSGQMDYSGYAGLADLTHTVSIKENTVFGLASITKQFTASCIAILENRGMLSVNDDVRKHVPELPFFKDTIRIKHLLNHTSGLRNHNILLELQGFDFDHQGYTNEMIEEIIFRQKGVNHKPGEKSLYSNSNYVLLALVVKRLGKKSFSDFVHDELLAPLGMENSLIRKHLHQVVKNSTKPYYKDKDTYKSPKSLTPCSGAGGMNSTIADMANWSAILTNSSSTLPFLYPFLTTLDTLNNGTKIKCARGLFLSEYRGFETINHGGRDFGMRAQIIAVPELNICVVVLTNSEHINAERISYLILDQLMPPSEEKKDEAKRYAHSTKELEKFVGTYQELNSDLLMHLTLRNDTLWAQSSFGSEPVPLSSRSKFSMQRQDNSSVVYQLHPKNEVSPLTIDFGGGVFYFEPIALEKAEAIDLTDFEGEYYSTELSVKYEFYIENDALYLRYAHYDKLKVYSRRKDEFGTNRRIRFRFIRDHSQNITGFSVAAESTVKGIQFEKIQ